MSECPLINKCPFFDYRLESKPAIANLYKSKYCKSDNSKCARWIVATELGKESVPPSLYPNQHDLAEQLINSKSKKIV